MTIEEKIEEIVKNYYNKVDECTNRLRFDNLEKEYWIEKELECFLKNEEIEHIIKLEECVDECSYSLHLFIISYIENSQLKIYIKKLESY